MLSMDYIRFEDYKKAVILAYENKKKEGTLPHNLLHHTDASLKKECLQEFLSRYLPKDNETFKDIFGRAETKEDYYNIIDQSRASLLRPLNNFLRRGTDGTHKRYFEMLAWLIDFEPRPFIGGDPYKLAKTTNNPPVKAPERLPLPEPIPEKIVEQDDESNDKIPEKETEQNYSTEKILTNTPIDDPIVPTNSVKGGKSNKLLKQLRSFCKPITDRPKIFLGLLVIVISILGLYFIFRPVKMYWDKFEYKTIAFYEHVNGAFTVPLDTLQLNNQRKIRDWSIITRNSIGIVHYSKINNKVEFFTIGGTNPEDTTRRLLPLTEYIYEKYVASKFK